MMEQSKKNRLMAYAEYDKRKKSKAVKQSNGAASSISAVKK
ncbi:hypothetical protein [Blautia producta]|nr:hypothetical protein [Blautia producta]